MKKLIIKALTYLAFIINMTSLCCMDSIGWVFGVVILAFILSGAWLLLLAWAYGWIGSTDGTW